MIGLGRTPCDKGVICATAPAAPGCTERAKPWVLATTVLSSSMAFIDGSVVNVALPAMQAELGTSVSGAQWVLNSYMLMLGALILVGAAAGDRFGWRRVFALGVTVFTAASVVCGLAPSATALTTAFGPVLGGWLVDAWSWRVIFFVNVPVAVVALGLAYRHVPESRDNTDAVDWRGGLLAAAGLGIHGNRQYISAAYRNKR
jgi:hypothetical protein